MFKLETAMASQSESVSNIQYFSPGGVQYAHPNPSSPDMFALPSAVSPLPKTPNFENSPVRNTHKSSNPPTPMKGSAPSSPTNLPHSSNLNTTMEQILEFLPKRMKFEGIPTLPEAAVFRPTEEEFQDPMKYLKSIREKGQEFGICKIIPPSDKWRQGKTLSDMIDPETYLFPTKVQNIYQLQHRQGPYSRFMDELTTFLKERKIGFKSNPTIEGREVNLFKLYRTVISLGGVQQVIEDKRWKEVARTLKLSETSSATSSLKQLYLKLLWEFELFQTAKAQGVAEQPQPKRKKSKSDSDDEEESFGYGDGKYYTFSDFQKYANTFKRKWFPNDSQATPKEIEKTYWEIVETAEDHVRVFYGSDVEVSTYGSGFPSDPNELSGASGWNLNIFSTQPGSVLKYLGEQVSGVTQPMMYIGMLFSTFCWHTEDNYLYSINYLHDGAPKTWYGIPAHAAEQFEEVMRNTVPELFASQPNLLFMLVTMISPRILVDHGVPVYTTVQEAGEFMITFPKGYHAGFSHGFNCAESSNFALDDWIPFGRECVERYRHYARPSVLSLEKLLCTAAVTPGALEFIPRLREELSMIRDRESFLREKVLTKDGTWKCLHFDDFDESDKLVECSVCRYDCYLSGIVCPCAPNRVMCLRHAELTCDCEASRKMLLFRHKLSDLDKMLENLGWKKDDHSNDTCHKAGHVTSIGKGHGGTHRQKTQNQLTGVTKPVIKRLARLAGVTPVKSVNYQEEPASDMEGMYIVEKITDSRSFKGTTEYLVKWLGYPEEESTWVPAADLGMKYLIEQYHNGKKGIVTRRMSRAAPSQRRGRMMGMTSM